jgi:hypothetical protein
MVRWLLRHDNPELPEQWVARIADHLRDRDIDTLVVWGDRDVSLPVGRTGRGSSNPSASPTSSPGFCESGSAA